MADKRLTRPKDKYPCRIKDCYAEDWMEAVYGYFPEVFKTKTPCEICPFEKYINKLAEYEDEKEKFWEDDLK